MENDSPITRPKGRFPLPTVPGVRNTTRRVGAAFNPRNILNRISSSSSLRASIASLQLEQVEGPDDPQEPATVLTSLASERPNPLADLSTMLPVSRSFADEQGFRALCSDFMVLNARDHMDPTVRSIKIPGTKRGRNLQGGILADEAGTGKTYTFLAACLLRALAFQSSQTVKLHWATSKNKRKAGKQPEQHLEEGANGRSCPSQKAGHLVCYCVGDSWTRLLVDRTARGVNVVYAALETWPDVLNIATTSGLDPSIFQLCLVHNNVPMRFTRPLQPLGKTLSPGAATDLKSPPPESFIFITTLNSPRLWNAFPEGGLNAGLVIVDEAHQVIRMKDSLTLKMAEQYSDNGADVWFVTATPFSGCTLQDWSPAMSLIAPSRAPAMEALISALDRARSSGRADDERAFRNRWNAVFDEDLVVRHFGTSTFLGKSISDVQSIQPRVISRNTPAEHKAAVQELAVHIARRDPHLRDPGQRGLLYLVSLFPAAAQLILDDPIALETAAISDHVRALKNRLRIEDSEPLQRIGARIIGDSPKLEYIVDELIRMSSDNRGRQPVDNASNSRFGAGEDLLLKKMVIITPTAVSAIFLYLALIRVRKDVAIVHNWVSSSEKQQIITHFQSLSAAKLVKHNRVLVAPFGVAGTGVNLQTASYEILTSPLPEKSSEVQAFARTNRSGQRLPLSHKILVLEDSPVDRIMIARHATRDIESDPFQIDEPLRLSDGDIALGNLVETAGVVEPNLPSSHTSSLGMEDLPAALQGININEEGELEGEDSRDLYGFPESSSPVPTSDPQVEDGISTAVIPLHDPVTPGDVVPRSSSSGSQWQLTYTPSPVDLSLPGMQTPGGRTIPIRPRPMPALPSSDLESSSSPTDPDPFSGMTTPPATRYQIRRDRDNFKIWVSDSSTPSSDGLPRPAGPLTLNLPADFTPSIVNITNMVDGIRRGQRPTQRGKPLIRLGPVDQTPTRSAKSRQGRVIPGPIERGPPTLPPVPREYGDDLVPREDPPFSVLDLPLPAGPSAFNTDLERDMFEEEEHDEETLERRRQAALARGGLRRIPGREFQ
ncbi:hypothetical protein diail_8758 [Diaporthe ilicicola]|nr:hypothetical protein diail_8758 [Diaporthe ilicicola]